MLLSGHPANTQSAIVPEMRTNATKVWIGRVTLPLAATALLALCSRISFPLPFTPIPATMQTFAVLLIGMTLGPVAAVSTMVLYLVEGASGLPVFSPHGVGGLAQLSGTSGGYLLAYPLSACIVGPIFRRLKVLVPTFLAVLAASLIADALILLCGATWLASLLHRTPHQAFSLGIAPFLAGETLKLLLLAVSVTALQQSRPSR